jgi:DNA-directed RNA polymerase specialized sigma subunit
LNKVEKYDVEKGQFLIWLKTVIRNTVRDWLRKVDSENGLSNFEKLSHLGDVYKNTEPLSEIEPVDVMPDANIGEIILCFKIFSTP